MGISTLFVFLLGFMNGTTLLASRFSVGQYSTSNYLTMRLLIASICYGLLVLIIQKDKGNFFPKSKKFWIGSITVGIFSSISMNTIIMAMNYISSGINSILMTIGPALTVLLAHFLLNDERLSMRKAIGICLALAGGIFIVISGESGLQGIENANRIGYFLSLTGVISFSYSSVFVRKYLSDFSAVHVSAVRNFVTLVVSALLSLLVFGFNFSGVDTTGYTVLFYSALVGTFAAHLLSVHVNQKFGATTISMTAYIIPIITSIGGVILFNEEITIKTMIGMILIFTGIMVINDIFSKFKYPVPN